MNEWRWHYQQQHTWQRHSQTRYVSWGTTSLTLEYSWEEKPKSDQVSRDPTASLQEREEHDKSHCRVVIRKMQKVEKFGKPVLQQINWREKKTRGKPGQFRMLQQQHNWPAHARRGSWGRRPSGSPGACYLMPGATPPPLPPQTAQGDNIPPAETHCYRRKTRYIN